MKRRTAQEEAIGTAAVDLFASGMGAFILIAILFIVLLAASLENDNVNAEAPEQTVAKSEPDCPIVETVACPPVTACPEVPATPACPEVPAAPASPEPVVTVECPEPKIIEKVVYQCLETNQQDKCPVCPPITALVVEPQEKQSVQAPAEVTLVGSSIDTVNILPDFDLVLVLDSTSSMGPEIESLKRNLYILVDVLEEIMPSVAIGIVTFNDRNQNPVVQQHPLKRLTGDSKALAELQRFLRGIEAGSARGNNPDTPEAVSAALQSAVTASFRPKVANRAVILITDAYAYAEEMQETFELAKRFASVPGQRVSAVHINADPNSESYLRRLSESGNGSLVPDRGSILANVLLTIL